MTIYQTSIASRLVDNPQDEFLRRHLESERDFVMDVADEFDTIIEVGCAFGRFAREVLDRGKLYIGIDNIPRYIEKAIKINRTEARRPLFYCSDILEAKSFLEFIQQNFSRPLMVLPMNMIGSIEQLPRLFKILSDLHVNFLATGFDTTDDAIDLRELYYAHAGFVNLVISMEEKGVRIYDDSGLDTVAYTPKFLKSVFNRAGLSFRAEKFGESGVGYMNF